MLDIMNLAPAITHDSFRSQSQSQPTLHSSLPRPLTSSTSLSRRLIRHPLRSHLALDSPRLPPRRSSRTLRLLGLLLALGRRFLLLALGNSLLACCLAGLGTLRTAVFDEFEGCTDDASLLLHSTAGALLGGFLSVVGVISGLNEGDKELKEVGTGGDRN